MANESWIYCTGPIHAWVRFTPPIGTGGTSSVLPSGPIIHLGTCEQHPTDDDSNEYEPVMNDIGGPKVPFDKQYQGSTEIIVMDLNKLSYAIMQRITSPPYFDGSVGYTNRLARGSLMLQQGLAFELWLQYSFYGTANAVPDLPPGTYYPAVTTIASQTPKQGTKAKLRRVILEAANWYNRSDGSFLLKSQDLADFAGIPAPPA